jgi:hypothetical protein
LHTMRKRRKPRRWIPPAADAPVEIFVYEDLLKGPGFHHWRGGAFLYTSDMRLIQAYARQVSALHPISLNG